MKTSKQVIKLAEITDLSRKKQRNHAYKPIPTRVVIDVSQILRKLCYSEQN